MISHDFASRLLCLAQLQRRTYARGFWTGAAFATAVILFVVFYLHTGSNP